MVAVTRRCNLQCGHCYVDAGIPYGPEMTVTEHAFAAQELARHLAADDQRVYRVNLTGGEPFVHTGILDIIAVYQAAGFKMAMSTNGLLITEMQAAYLAEHHITVSVSLDGASAPTHDTIRGYGTFVKVVHQIRMLHQVGVRVGINHLVHHGNFHELEATVVLAQELGCNGFNPINLIQLGRACDSVLQRVSEAEIFRRLAVLLHEKPELRGMFQRTSLFSSLGAALLAGVTCLSCGVGNRPCVYINPEGDIFPCANTQWNEFRLGNVRTDIAAALQPNHPTLQMLRQLEVDTLNDRCAICAVRRFCGGDCRGETYNVTGDLHAPYVACEDRFASLVELMWIAAEFPEFFAERVEEFTSNYALAV